MNEIRYCLPWTNSSRRSTLIVLLAGEPDLRHRRGCFLPQSMRAAATPPEPKVPRTLGWNPTSVSHPNLCHPEAAAFCPPKDPGEPRDVSQPALSEAEGFCATHKSRFRLASLSPLYVVTHLLNNDLLLLRVHSALRRLR